MADATGGITLGALSLATTLAHAQLRNHFHACAFVTDASEETAVIDPFFVEGMRRRATGYGQHNDRLRAVDAGFDCHLIKPVSVHDLVVLLDERIVGTTTAAAPLRPRSGRD
jgi:hypothetical protein